MKALQLLGSAKDGGAETYFLALVEALQSGGASQASGLRHHETPERRLKEIGVPAAVAPFGGPLDLSTRGKVKRFAKDQQAGVLVAWMNRAARHAPRGPWGRIGRLGGYYG